MRLGKFRAGDSALRRKVEVKQNPRRIPARDRPQDQCRKEDEDAEPFPRLSGSSAFPYCPQYFGTLRDIDKHGPGNESDDEAETTWL